VEASHRSIARAALISLAATVAGFPARGRPDYPGSPDGAGRAPETVPEEGLPTGAPLVTEPRPEGFEPPACSLRRPVCVHRASVVPESVAAVALTALESAYERLVLALRLPSPERDRGRGGTDGLDLYLFPPEPAARGEVELALDPVDPWGFDRASGSCRAVAASAVDLARTAALCVGEAVAARLDPAATPSLRRAYALHLWLATGAPTGTDLAVIEDAQVTPERAVASRDQGPGTAGAALLLEHLDATRGGGGPGALATGLLAAAASDTRAEALTWNDEPDLLDVIRHTLGARPAETAQLFGGFAVARGFLGSRDDCTHFPRLTTVGDAGRIRFDWSLPLSTLPRRVATTRPIEPTGSVYVWIDLDEVLTRGRLGFEAEWEPPATFQWSLVRVSADGRELSRVSAPYQEQTTSAVQHLDDLASAAAVVIVGTNLGGRGPGRPHDPDLAPLVPSGCTVYVTPL